MSKEKRQEVSNVIAKILKIAPVVTGIIFFFLLAILLYAILREFHLWNSSICKGKCHYKNFFGLGTLSLMFTTINLNNVILCFFHDRQKNYGYGINLYLLLDSVLIKNLLSLIRVVSVLSFIVALAAFAFEWKRIMFSVFLICMYCCILLLFLCWLVNSKSFVKGLVLSLVKKFFDASHTALQKNTGLEKKDVLNAEKFEIGIHSLLCQRIDLQQKDYFIYSNEILQNVASFNLLSSDSLEEIRCMYFIFIDMIKKIEKETEGQKFITYFQIYDMTIKLCMNARIQFNTNTDNQLYEEGLQSIFQEVFQSLNEMAASDKNVLQKFTYVAIAVAALESGIREVEKIIRHFLEKPRNYFMQAIVFLYCEGTFLKNEEGKSYDIFYNQNRELLFLNFNMIAETIECEEQLFNEIFLYWEMIENKRKDKMEGNAQRLVNDLRNWGNIGFIPKSNVLYVLRRGSEVSNEQSE